MYKSEAYADGKLGAKGQVVSTEIIGEVGTLADTEILVSKFEKAGLYIVDAGDDSTIIKVKATGGTVATELIGASTNITVTKDNADTINVYVEDDVVKVQNLLGSEIDVAVKAYL